METRRFDNLAAAYQELFTVIVRLRGGRQTVNDAMVFRSQVMTALKAAEDEAAAKGYAAEDIRVSTFAVIGFLDESILNSHNPVFGDWLKSPLQQEIFGVQIAGEIFFRNLDRLQTRQDSQALADLLEVHELCLLLGFSGRYSVGDPSQVRSIAHSLQDRIRRIRGSSWPASPDWAPQAGQLAASRDGSLRYFAWTAVGVWVCAITLFVVYKVLLHSSVVF